MLVRDLAVRRPVTVDVAATVAETAAVLAQEGVGSVIVIDHDVPVGMVTDRDIVVRGVARGVPADGRIDSLMTMGVVTVDADADLDELVRIFGEQAVRRVPVVEGGRVTGMVSLDDMLVRFTSHLEHLTRGLTAQLLFPHAADEAPPPAVN